jgi:hypothetical protein
MTVEAVPPFVSNPIAGIGPYGVPFGYLTGALQVYVQTGTAQRVALASDEFSVTPLSADVSGDVYLTPAAAAAYAGANLLIVRVTGDEQGWQGTQGERERGLERQLDRTTMAVQELRREVGNAFRLDQPIKPGQAVPGRTLIFTEAGFAAGPNTEQIVSAQQFALDADAAKQAAQNAEIAAVAAADLADASKFEAQNQAASAGSSAAAASATLLALGEALSNVLGAFSVDANGDLLVAYNSTVISNIEISASSGDLLLTYEV